MKIKKLYLSDEVVLTVAEDIAKRFTIPKYEQFLTKHSLLSYNPNDYSYFNKVDFIRATLGEIDTRLFFILYDDDFLPNEIKEALIQEKVVFENSEKNSKISRQQVEASPPQIRPKINPSANTAHQNIENIKNGKKSSLLYFLLVFLVILIALMIVRAIVPDNMVFSVIVVASIIILVAVGILSFKHDGIISDDTFIKAMDKVQKMMGFFQIKK